MFDKSDERQWIKIKNAEQILRLWAEIRQIPFYRMEFVTGESMYIGLGVYIFYKTNQELKHYTKNGVLEQTKQKFMGILKEIGYIEEFNDNVNFSFDSDEHVQKNYKGNYGLRLKDD